MNLFNNIEKFNYSDEDKKCVSLEEYIVFDDEKQYSKYIVFKFRNNLLQELHEIRFEVYQYDEKENLVEKNVLFYNDISALPEELFVPNAKLKANYLCKTISVKLIYAKFDTAVFENDKLHSANFSFKKYNEQMNREKKHKMTKKELKLLIKKQKEEEKILKKEKKLDEQFSRIEAKNEFLLKEKKVKSKYLKRLFSIKNTSPNNTTHSANAILAIGFIGILGFSLWSTLFYRNKSNFYDYGDYSFYSYDNESSGVMKYYGNDSIVVVPSVSQFIRNGDMLAPLFGMVGTETEYRKTTKIENECFMNSKIEKVSIQNDITIGKKAFYNCKKLSVVYADKINSIEEYAFSGTSLTSFYSDSCTSIGEYAFENVKELKSVNSPNSFVVANAFKGCDSINSITIGSTNARSIGEIFGVQNHEIPKSITDIWINQKNIPSGFFYDLDKSISLHLIDGVSVEKDIYGENRKFDSDAIVVENSKLVSIALPVLRLTIPETIAEVNEGVENKFYSNLTSVVINSPNFDYVSLIKANPQIKELIFNVYVDIPSNLFDEMSSLVRLEFNNSVSFNETSPFKGIKKLDWLVISGLQGDSFISLFGNEEMSIHYLEIKDSIIDYEFFKNVEVNSLSLVNCDVRDGVFTGARRIKFVYVNSNKYYDEDLFYKDLNNLSVNTVLFDKTVDFKESYSFDTKFGVYKRNYVLSYNGLKMSVSMNFFTFLPISLSSLLHDEQGYNQNPIYLSNKTGAPLYIYGAVVDLQ